MLSDRPYMRDDYERERTSFLLWLLSAMIAGFVIQQVFNVYTTVHFDPYFALSSPALRAGWYWTLFTFPLLHRGILHLLFLALSVFFIGRELLPHLGDRRMAGLTAGAVVFSGLIWFGFHFRGSEMIMGSATIFLAYLTVFACLFPNREISFLVFFFLPVTTRPKYIAWVILGVELCGFIFREMPGARFTVGASVPDLPYSAHLGAMLVGWLYYRLFHEGGFSLRPATDVELPRWMKRAKKAPVAVAPTYRVNVNTREDIRAEVDRILDKINSKGFGALTPEEKRLLDDAKDILSRR